MLREDESGNTIGNRFTLGIFLETYKKAAHNVLSTLAEVESVVAESD